MIECDQGHKGGLFDYFSCLQGKNSQYVRTFDLYNKQMNQCTINFDECKEKCEVSFKGFDEELTKCESKCSSNAERCVLANSLEFYKIELGDYKGWSQAKKLSEQSN